LLTGHRQLTTDHGLQSKSLLYFGRVIA
jgi:hypothetical protein